MRSDIQTLRAVAVLLVLLWHAGVPGVPGGYVGVDVFLVISGFLMTRIILAELAERGRLDLPAFYLRRARRLFPAAAAALAGTVVITLVLLPSTRWREVGGDLLASGVYLVNWRFAERSVDYLAADSAPSPVLHFWSLAVEEQFYLVWPVLLVLAFLLPLARRRSGPFPRGHAAAAVVGALVVLASLGWSVWLTAVDPGRAYFVTTTRLWELALGAVVAALWPLWSTRPPRPVLAAALVAAGLGAVGLSAVLLDTSTPFPGVAALLPTAGTAAVLLGGPFVRTGGLVARLLDLRPALWVGGLSYSLYLWHWPMLVGATAWLGAATLPWPVGVAVAAASFLPAWLSLRHVETPFRGRVPRAAPAVTGARVGRWVAGYAGAAAVCALTVVLAAQVLVPGGTPSRPGSAAAAVVPTPEDAADDVYRPYYDGCDPLAHGSEVTRCVGGDPEGDRTVVLMGDSHAVMWMPAVDAAGRERGWRVELMAKTSCPAADVIPQLEKGPREVCGDWLEEVLAELGARPPAAVLTAHVAIPPLHVGGEVVPSAESGPQFSAGLVRTWSSLRATGAQVVSVTPTPRFPTSRPECVARHRDEPGACAAAADVALAPVRAPVDAALDRAPWVHELDLSERLCPAGSCPAVDDGVLVYSDTNHLTRTRVLQLADPVGDALGQVLDTARR